MTTKNIQDFYPLSPMQQGMFFHSLYAPESGVYVEQLTCTLRGELDCAAFQRAWQRVVDRHPILRTAFLGQGLKEPIQVVHRQVQIEVEQQDWSHLSSREREARLEGWLQTQRAKLDLSTPPLMRLAVMKLADDAWKFAWSYHHILLDGWSVPILMREVLAFYEALRHGQELRLEPARPFRDYIAWLRRQDLAQAERFWRQVLAGFSTPTPLVVNRPAGDSGDSGDFENQEIYLSPEKTRALRELAQRHQLTLNTLVQGAWALLWSRYSGEEDVLFGVTVSGRPPDLPGAESMLGLFINTLPLRVHVPPDMPLIAWLKELQALQLEMRQYEYSPLVQIQGWSEVPRGIPLFNSILVFENYPIQADLRAQRGSLQFEDVRSVEKTNYPLNLISGVADALLLRIAYGKPHFEADTIRRMLEHLQLLLESMADDPERPLAAMLLLTEAEKHQILVEWNSTRASYPDNLCAHQLFEKRARRNPNATALALEGQTMTYGELNQCANQLARCLRKLGIGPETLVAICMEPSFEMIISILGTLKAGGAYVPLDPNYPRQRLAFMLEDCAAPLLLTQSSLVDNLPEQATRVICLDNDWCDLAREDVEDLPCQTTPQNLAYVIYTSGSTGRPKGTLLEHRGLVNLVSACRLEFEIKQSSRFLQFFSPSFDASVLEIFSTLLSGATLYLARAETKMALPDLHALMEKEKITHAAMTPSILAVLPADNLPHLRVVISGGERCTTEIVGKWAPGRRFINAYGPTETTVAATWCRIKMPFDKTRSIPIGRPIRNTCAYVLDQQLRPVPVGVPGELYIGGVGVGRGYLNRPDLTAERFITDPFNGEPGARLYKTGDLVRYLPDGNIEFLGRIDNQVKIRGFRIELGEIESLLAQHPAVRDAVVIVREDTPGDKQLAAYTVPQPESSCSPSELRAFLQEKLPAYMLPSTFTFLDALPLTPNGKVDRRALPAPTEAAHAAKEAYIAPRNMHEEILYGLVSQVLGIERVGVQDNFFDLGGHSLLATQLVSRIRQAFEVELPLRTLFETPIVGELAQKIELLQRAGAGVDAPPIVPVPREGELPLSFGQQRLWFLDQLEPNSPAYNIPSAVRINGPLDIDVLKCSLNELIRRHEGLRTRFVSIEGKAVQEIGSAFTLTLPVTDLSHLPPSEREAKAHHLAMQEALCPFDLSRGPLLRTQLLRLGDQEHIILLTMHHIVSDGWSSGILIRELAALYEAFSRGQPSPLPELPIQYADFAYWQRQWLQGEVLERQLAYWKEQLRDCPPQIKLPTDRPRPALQSANGGTFAFELPEALSQEILRLTKREGVSLFMTLLAAFQVLLYRYSGQEDICVGTPIANRNHAEIEGLIGFFVNTLVMRGNLSGDPSFRELLKHVRETALGAYAHQDLPFEMLVDALQPQRDMTRTPLFQVMFALQNTPLETLELPGLTFAPLDVDTGVSMFDLTLSMQEGGGRLSGAFEYNADLFDANTIERMAAHYQNLLAALSAHPEQPISQASLMSEEEREKILYHWNQTNVAFPQDVCLPQLFEAQVARNPDAVAVIFPGHARQQLTYDDLNRRANQLAHYLRDCGVGPDTMVGLCVSRSLDMVIGLLAILKAGGAYVPLDPGYPAERLAFMLQDCGANVLLTQQHLINRLPTHQARVICLDADWATIAQAIDQNLPPLAKPDNLAYVIYTSGSTGQPKGVIVSHANVVNHNLAVARQFDLTSEDRVLQFSTINFDAAVEEIFPTWFCGATLVLRPGETISTAEELLQLVEQEKITLLDLPTAYWHELVYELSLLHKPVPASLRLVVVGGEKASPERLRTWQTLVGPKVRWINTYGPTEGTIIASAYEPALDGGRLDSITNIPIGRPIANVRLYVLDSHLNPVPVGVEGELYIGGAGVARGYLNRPDLTAERFIPDPFSNSPGVRLYRTGDLARYRPDSNIEFLGRGDDQVKVRGFRVELGEIENVLSAAPDLRDSVVLAPEDSSGNRHLVAYVVPERQEVANPGPIQTEWLGILQTFLRDKLPEYMLPSAFVVLQSLPIGPTGKVDRQKLPALGQAHWARKEHVPPRTPREKLLADVWSQVLGVEKVGIHDNFFELGGDSILSIQMVARARQVGLHLTARQVFEHQTVAELASVAGTGQVILAKQGPVTGPVPLTPIQHWFFEHHPDHPHRWNSSMFLEVFENLDVARLEETLRQLLIHHDALRLRFYPSESGWQQINHDIENAVPFSHVDLSGEPVGAQREKIESIAAAAQASLDISNGPLMRMIYFTLGSGQSNRLLIIFHHLVTDGVSWRIFLEDLLRVYQRLDSRPTVSLPPKTTSFQEWARRLSEYAQSSQLLEELDYWKSPNVEHISPLPVDLSGANTYGSMAHVTLSLGTSETQALLQGAPTTYGTQINDILYTALAKTFYHWTGNPWLWVEMEGHGREEILDGVDLSRTMGWFTSAFPVLLNIENAKGPNEELTLIQDQLRRIPRRGIGYGLLRYLCKNSEARRALSKLPDPEVSFNYLGQFDSIPVTEEIIPFRVASESLGQEQSPDDTADVLLNIVAIVTGGQLGVRWGYSRNLYRRDTIEKLAERFMAELRELVAQCAVNVQSH